MNLHLNIFSYNIFFLISVCFVVITSATNYYIFLQDLLENNASSRKKLAVNVVSMAEGGAGREKEIDTFVDGRSSSCINNITVFKSLHEMFPLVQPYINITRKGNKCKL